MGITAGKDPLHIGGKGYSISLDGSPAAQLQSCGVSQKGRIRPLADSGQHPVGFHDKLAARYRHRPPSAGGIRFSQLHANALYPNHFVIFGEDLLRRGEVLDLHPFS